MSKKAIKNIKKVPAYIVTKLAQWVEAVQEDTLEEVRKIPGYLTSH